LANVRCAAIAVKSIVTGATFDIVSAQAPVS
jgi:hypothetical protein